jgi:putative flippase GtrA
MAADLSRIRPTPHARLTRPFGRFIVVGLSNTAISFVVYTGLLSIGVVYWIAGGLGFAAGAINGYLLNRRWTFASPDSWRARIRYVVVQLGGLLGTAALLWLLISSAHIGHLGAYGVVIPVVTVTTFLVNHSWTFGARN